MIKIEMKIGNKGHIICLTIELYHLDLIRERMEMQLS